MRILVLPSWHIPDNLIIFLTALAIVDNLGAVLIIAIFCTHGINLMALGAAAGVFVLLIILFPITQTRSWRPGTFTLAIVKPFSSLV